MISFIIPVYNEEKNVPLIVKEIEETMDSIEFEIIFQEDGSSDKTPQLISELSQNKRHIHSFSSKNRLGKGGAFREGVSNAKGEIIVLIDADVATHPKEIHNFLPYFDEGYDILVGSREVKGAKRIPDQPFYRKLLGKGYSLMVRTLFWTNLIDYQCGFKMFKKDVFNSITIENTGFEFDTEIIAKATKLKMKIKELPITWSDKGNSSVSLYPDVFKMFLGLIKLRFKL